MDDDKLEDSEDSDVLKNEDAPREISNAEWTSLIVDKDDEARPCASLLMMGPLTDLYMVDLVP